MFDNGGSVEKAFREVRLLHFAFVGCWFLLLLVSKFVTSPTSSLPLNIPAALGIASLMDITIGFRLRSKNLAEAAKILSQDPEDRTGIAKWRVANVLSFAFAQTVTLFGFVLEVLGSEWRIAGIFYGVGLLLLILWTPRKMEALPQGVR